MQRRPLAKLLVQDRRASQRALLATGLQAECGGRFRVEGQGVGRFRVEGLGSLFMGLIGMSRFLVGEIS